MQAPGIVSILGESELELESLTAGAQQSKWTSLSSCHDPSCAPPLLPSSAKPVDAHFESVFNEHSNKKRPVDIRTIENNDSYVSV